MATAPVAESFDISTPSKPTISKDVDAVLDYSEDWTAWLLEVTDTIASAEMVLLDSDSTITLDPDHPEPITDGVIVTMWLAGGRLGEKEAVTFRIHTTGGRTDDRTIYLKMVER